MVEYRCSTEESYEATQVLGKIYESIAKHFPDVSNAQMVLTWMLYRANLDHRVGTLHLGATDPLPSRMPGWDQITRHIVPTIKRNGGDPEKTFEFYNTANIPKNAYLAIVDHIYSKAIEYGALVGRFAR